MKLRYWYKVDQNKQPIPGSNVRRKSRPGPKFQWKEILDSCCLPLDVTCTCDPRYFVQLDSRNKPVDGSLIKRPHGDIPEGTDGMKFYELDWKSTCCAEISWSFQVTTSTGSLVITINGNEKVNTIIGGNSGSFKANPNDVIEVTLTNTGNAPITNSLVITGGTTFSATTTPVTTHTFLWNVKNTNIAAAITGS